MSYSFAAGVAGVLLAAVFAVGAATSGDSIDAGGSGGGGPVQRVPDTGFGPDGTTGPRPTVEATATQPANIKVALPDGASSGAGNFVLDLSVTSKWAASARVVLRDPRGGAPVEIGQFSVLPDMFAAPRSAGDTTAMTMVRLRLDAVAARGMLGSRDATIEVQVVDPVTSLGGGSASVEGLAPLTITGARIVAR